MPTFDQDGTRHDVTRINFQPERTEIPAGFLADKGKDYALRSNTLTYGWTAPEGTPSRDPALIRRFHPMPQYDTTSPMGSGWTWQVALANGSYPVIVVMGDATSRHHTNNVVVQGQAQSDPDPYDAAETQSYLKGDFDGYAAQATVTDGVLKIEVGADALDPVLAFIEIGPEGMQLTQEMKDRLAAEIEAATNRTGGKPYGKGNDIEVKSQVYSGDYVDDIVMVETKSGRFYVHSNAQFSPMAISNAAGEVVERRQYGPYGEIEVNEEGVPPVELSVGYTGREWDADIQAYYFRERWYLPRLGRFVNRDPLTYVDGMSMYAAYFAPGGMDPSGTLDVEPGGGSTWIFEKWTVKQREAWYGRARDAWLQDVQRISLRHCVPWRVVFTVILNEYADVTLAELLRENDGWGSSVGIGQVTLDTARRIGMTRENGSAVDRDYLLSTIGSIEAVAQNLNHNLTRIMEGSGTQSFNSFAGCDLKSLECEQMSCRDWYNYSGKLLNCMITGMAAAHNSHRVIEAKDEIRDRSDRGGNFPDAYSMGIFGLTIGLEKPWEGK